MLPVWISLYLSLYAVAIRGENQSNFYVPDVKTAENEKSWSDKPLATPIATSEIVLLYALSNLTKRSDKSFDSALFISWQIFCLPFDLP